MRSSVAINDTIEMHHFIGRHRVSIGSDGVWRYDGSRLPFLKSISSISIMNVII